MKIDPESNGESYRDGTGTVDLVDVDDLSVEVLRAVDGVPELGTVTGLTSLVRSMMPNLAPDSIIPWLLVGRVARHQPMKYWPATPSDRPSIPR